MDLFGKYNYQLIIFVCKCDQKLRHIYIGYINLQSIAEKMFLKCNILSKDNVDEVSYV